MSLVVAHQKAGVIAAVADTGIMQNDAPLGWDSHRPKISIVRPDLAVGFAGDPDLAARIITEVSLQDDLSYRSVTQFVLDRHRDINEAVDFLVLFNKPTSKIARIRRGICSSIMYSAWIGDKQAFDAFQRYKF